MWTDGYRCREGSSEKEKEKINNILVSFKEMLHTSLWHNTHVHDLQLNNSDYMHLHYGYYSCMFYMIFPNKQRLML